MNATAALEATASTPSIVRPIRDLPIFTVTGAAAIAIRAGTTVDGVAFAGDRSVTVPDLVAGTDYAVRLIDGMPVAEACPDGVPADAIGGFHFAPGGNATARAGGDAVPAINKFSCWDTGFRPACPDPRGMARVEQFGLRFWCDIYLLGVDHLAGGTSRCGETIADGGDRPTAADGSGKAARCDYPTVQAIYARHGKQLLTYDQFRAAAYGVTERSAAPKEPKTTGLDAAHTSRFGLMQATGNMWAWGTDGDADDPRPSIFGGSWISGSFAGSRYAFLGVWPDGSDGGFSARGRCDHLTLD